MNTFDKDASILIHCIYLSFMCVGGQGGGAGLQLMFLSGQYVFKNSTLIVHLLDIYKLRVFRGRQQYSLNVLPVFQIIYMHGFVFSLQHFCDVSLYLTSTQVGSLPVTHSYFVKHYLSSRLLRRFKVRLLVRYHSVCYIGRYN